MNLFTKLDSRVDYNNHYSMRKGLETLRQEFENAVKFKNVSYAKDVTHALKQFYDKLHASYRQSEDLGETMSYSQRRISVMMQELFAQFSKRLRTDFLADIKDGDEISGTTDKNML